MIDRGDIRQAMFVAKAYLGFTAGRWLWSVRHKADSLIAEPKRAERSERLMYEQSHRDYLALVYRIIVLPVMSC